MAYEAYNAPSAGLQGRYCLRDPETGRCFRDANGNLYTYLDAATAEAAKPVAKKQAKEAEVLAEPPKSESAAKSVRLQGAR